MPLTHEQFINFYLGKRTDYDSAYGFQCVDLNKLYADEVNEIELRAFGGGAKNAYYNWPKSAYDPLKWEKIDNDLKNKTQVPQKGDHIIFDSGVSNIYGHIGVVHEAFSGENKLSIIEQNGGRGSGKGLSEDSIRIRNVKYTNNGLGFGKVLCWFRPKTKKLDINFVRKDEIDKYLQIHETRDFDRAINMLQDKDSEIVKLRAKKKENIQERTKIAMKNMTEYINLKNQNNIVRLLNAINDRDLEIEELKK